MFLFPPPTVVCFHSFLSWFFSLLPQLYLYTPSLAALFHSDSFHCSFDSSLFSYSLSLLLQFFPFTTLSAVLFHSFFSCSFSHLLQLVLYTPPSFQLFLFTPLSFQLFLFTPPTSASSASSASSVILFHSCISSGSFPPPALAVPFHCFLWLFFFIP